MIFIGQKHNVFYCIVARCLINVVYLTHVPLSGMMTLQFFIDVANDADSTQKIDRIRWFEGESTW